MENPYISELKSAKKMIKKADDLLDVCINNIPNNIDKSLASIIDYECLCEKICNQARLIPNYTGQNLMPIVESNIVDINNIIIQYIENNWLYIKFPYLLTKKEKGSASYIRATIQVAFKHYIAEHKIERISKPSTIIFQHVYNKDTPEKRMRDHDNIEINVVVDSIALYALTDDSPMLLRHYYCSEAGDSTHTNIFIVPNTDFGLWLEKYQDKG